MTDWTDNDSALQAAGQTAIRSSANQARSLMSAPVRTVLPETSVQAVQATLLRYGHSGLCVVDDSGSLVGMISRRDVDIALRHGLGDRPIKQWMNERIISISPTTAISDAHDLMATHDIGRLPVLEDNRLVGIVTRTDLLRQLHHIRQDTADARRADGYADVVDTLHLRSPSADKLRQTLKNRLSAIWPALMLIAEVAEQKGWALYLIGGAVRDLLLDFVPNFSGASQPLTDIDLVVEGAEAGAGIALAEALQAQYPQVSMRIYGQFQTAALVWRAAGATKHAPAAFSVDIATARTEFYAHPAANPEVESSSIRQDLYRRDFAMNAMAISLTHGSSGLSVGTLLDFFGGWIDLQRHQVRVLHSNSFIEDPTRIFRAVRFAVRLGFALAPQTERFASAAISSGVYARMQASLNKTPALQSRLKAELKYLLQEKGWEKSLQELDRLGAWVCLDPDLKLTPLLWRQLRRMNRWLSKLTASQDGASKLRKRVLDAERTGISLQLSQPRWLILLELLLLQLPAQKAVRVGYNLNLSASSLYRLEHLPLQEAHLLDRLDSSTRPSQVYVLLKDYRLCELLLMSARHPHTIGAQIWQYIMRLSQIVSLIDGATLKRLGLQPGPQFRKILTEVHQLTLDGELTSVQAAEAYVLTHYSSSY